MYNKYRAAWCHICNQGWIEFVKEEDTGRIYLCCDECEAEWSDPEDVNIRDKGSRFKYGNIVYPSVLYH